MTRKDYVVIAASFKETYDRMTGYVNEGHRQFVEVRWGVVRSAEDMAIALRRDNPRFDYDKFIAACGIDYTEAGAR